MMLYSVPFDALVMLHSRHISYRVYIQYMCVFTCAYIHIINILMEIVPQDIWTKRFT